MSTLDERELEMMRSVLRLFAMLRRLEIPVSQRGKLLVQTHGYVRRIREL